MHRYGAIPVRAAILACAGVLLIASRFAAAAAPEAGNPVDPVDLGRWMSELWTPVASYGGLLGPGDLENAVVVLYRRGAIPGDDRLPVGSRGLAIFELEPTGKYVRKALAEELLPCVSCMGTMGRDPDSAPFEIDIDDRKLSVGWIQNEDGLISVRLTFAWSPERQTYALIADDLARGDARTGLRSRRTRDFVSGREIRDGIAMPIEPRFVPIQEVRARDYR